MLRLLITLLLLCPALVLASPRAVDWLDLLPAEDYQAMLDMPEISHDWGTEEPGDFSNSLRSKDRNMPDVMYSTRVVSEMDGQHIELGGYPVPLETDEQGRYISFFLVPYPGACIHVPPPPPNQIVLVDYPGGIAITDIYQPLLLTGKLQVAQTSNELADASYRVQADKVVDYPYE